MTLFRFTISWVKLIYAVKTRFISFQLNRRNYYQCLIIFSIDSIDQWIKNYFYEHLLLGVCCNRRLQKEFRFSRWVLVFYLDYYSIIHHPFKYFKKSLDQLIFNNKSSESWFEFLVLFILVVLMIIWYF